MMNKESGYFDPENIEEQIEGMLETSQNASHETRLLHTLQTVTSYNTTEEDRITLQRARERIISRKSSQEWVEIIPLPEEKSPSHHEQYSEGERKKRKKSFSHLINAIAAVLVVGLTVGSWMTITRIVNPSENIPIFSQGTQQQNVYVLEQDALSKLDGPSGKTIWRHQVSPSMVSLYELFEVNGIVYAFFFSEIYAFKAKTGEVLWRYKVDVNKFPKTTEAITESFPVRDDKRLYLPFSIGIIALDLNNGRELWQQYSSEIWHQQSPSTYLLTAENDQLYISQGNQIYVLDSANGSIRWSKHIPSIPADNTNFGFQVIDGITYYFINNTLYAMREQDGQELWKYSGDKGTTISPYLLSEQGIVILSLVDQYGEGQELVALDAKSGSRQWAADPKLKFKLFYSEKNPSATGLSMVYGIDDTGENVNPRLYALDTKTGQIRWRGEICTCEYGWNRTTDQAFYIADGKNYMVYELSTGKILHQQKFEWPGMLEENNGIAYLQVPHRFYAVSIADNKLLWEYKIDQYGTSGKATPTFLLAP